MSLPALTPLIPTLPAMAQPSERQAPLPPVELPDEMSTRDSVDDRGRATFTPRADESAEMSDALRRGQSTSGARLAGALSVRRLTPSAETGPEVAQRRSPLTPSPAGINPRLLAMAMTQPIIQGLLADWSEGRTVRLSVPAIAGRPELLAQALAQAVSAPLSKAIIAAGMRQHGVTLAVPQAERIEPGLGALDPVGVNRNDMPQLPPQLGALQAMESSATATPDLTQLLQGPKTAAPDSPQVASRPSAIPSQPTTSVGSVSPDSNGLPVQSPVYGPTGNQSPAAPNLAVSLTLLPLPVYLGEQMAALAQQARRMSPAEPAADQRARRQGHRYDGAEPAVSSVMRAGRMLRGQVDLGTRGLLNFEIRSLNGRFCVALAATPELGVAAQPGLPALEAALQSLPGFTELHWNG